MWEMLSSWFKSNKTYLATVFLVSASAGLVVALLAVLYPPVLLMFASVSIFGWLPLAFLGSINAYLGALALSSIVTGVAFVASTGGAIVLNRLLDIGSHLYELFRSQEPVKNKINPDSMAYIRSHLESIERVDFDIEEDSDEFQDDASFDFPIFQSGQSAKAEQESIESDIALNP